MQTLLSSKLPIKLPAIPKRVEHYFVEPVDHIGYAIVWSSTMAAVALGSMRFVLIIVLRILPHFARLWAASFPTSVGAFSSTPIGLLFCCGIFFGLLNVYSVKQTRKAYKELHVWVISIRESWTSADGEQHTFQQLIIVWRTKTSKNIQDLCVLCVTTFQCIGMIWRYLHQEDQQLSFSGAKMVLNGDEMAAIVMTAISKGRSGRSDPDVPAVEQTPPVTPGIFGSVLSACQIRVVGPTGKEKVIDLERRKCLPPWVYLIARTLTGGWVSVDDLVKVYECDGWVDSEEIGQREDLRDRLRNRFNQQRFTLMKEINLALEEVGLPPTDLFRKDQRNDTYYWGIADAIEFQDLESFQECRTLLAGAKKPHPDKEAYHERLKASCLDFCARIGNPLALLNVDQTHEPWIRQMVTDVLRTYRNALNYLAIQAKKEAEKSSDEKVKLELQWEETEYWMTYALSCASTVGTPCGDYETLISKGETALQKTLNLCIRLNDPERATSAYQQFKELVEKDLVEDDDAAWEPQEQTKACWQRVLALSEAA